MEYYINECVVLLQEPGGPRVGLVEGFERSLRATRTFVARHSGFWMRRAA